MLFVTADEVGDSYEYDGYSLLLTGLLSVFDLLIKSSYICTNIIMMVSLQFFLHPRIVRERVKTLPPPLLLQFNEVSVEKDVLFHI